MKQKPSAIAGLSLAELEDTLHSLPAFRTRQIYKWITKGIFSFEEMTDIPVSMQNELNERFCFFSSAVAGCHEDNNAAKIVIALEDGANIESVLLNDGKNRFTACLSTQAGCPCGCVFCKTGSLGFKRNLEYTEITEQLLHLMAVQNRSGGGNKSAHMHLIDNIVIMGMGEPLLNLDNLYKAISIFTDPKGMNLSKRRITVSTCGICDGLFDISKNGQFIRLALSLTTADESLRTKLMPVTKNNPLEKIKEALAAYQKGGGGRITLEVPLLGGINTRSIDAKSIADFAKGLDTVVNIIPWNPCENLLFEGRKLCEPDKKEIRDFINMLESYKLKTTMRLHKGRSVMGACGQLGCTT
jgi:23S rRNA (adenine2503-C2)-methyltransferase